MADDRDDQSVSSDASPAEENPASSLLTRADTKMLLITFVGTVAANLVTVVMIGIALVLARHFRTSYAGSSRTGALLQYIVYPVIGLVAIALLVLWLRFGPRFVTKDTDGRMQPTNLDQMTRSLTWWLIAAISWIVVTGLLVWIGLAASIK